MRANATNIETLNAVEFRMNHDENGNLVRFPVHFDESRELFSRVDDFNDKIIQLKAQRDECARLADEQLAKEYAEKERYRIIHQFLSDIYTTDDFELKVIGKEVLHKLKYTNSKAICDHEGRWFRTVKEACKYHGVTPNVYYYRKRHGCTLKECFSQGRLKRSVIK
jgi:hypothetical protein